MKLRVATRKVLKRFDTFTTCAAVDDEAVWALSDHVPMVAELEI